MLKILLALVCLLAVTGCNSDGPCNPRYEICDTGSDPDRYLVHHLNSEWTVDPTLTAEEVEALLYAADAWTTATDGRVTMTFSIAAEGEPLPERMVVRRSRDGEGEPGWLAFYGQQSVKIRTDVDPKWLRPVLVHELGHFLGLGHEESKDSIMFHRIHEGMPEAPTVDACEDLAFLYGW